VNVGDLMLLARRDGLAGKPLRNFGMLLTGPVLHAINCAYDEARRNHAMGRHH
jgi:hypothetical protein